MISTVPVMSEEYVVSLVMKGTDSPTMELWVMRKQCGKQTTNTVTQSGVKIVENHLGVMG